MNKEEIYDTEIAPLMMQIIGICQKHGIAMIASYAIPIPGDGGLRCSSHLADGEGNFVFSREAAMVQQPSRAPTLMLTTKDKEGNVTGMTAVVG